MARGIDKRKLGRGYSLRTLLLVSTFTGVAMGVWAIDTRRQAAEVAAIEALGGHVYYDETPRISEAVDAWLVETAGEDGWRRVVTACPREASVTEALPHLQHLRGLERVHFWLIEDWRTAESIQEALPHVDVTVKTTWVY